MCSEILYAQFAKHEITKPSLRAISCMHTADLDGDGLSEIILAGEDMLVVLANTGSGQFADMDTLGNGLPDCRSIFANDVDNDGDLDIICGSNVNVSGWIGCTGSGGAPPFPPHSLKGRIMLYENLGAMSFGPGQMVSDSLGAVQSLMLTDLDGDSYNDMLLGVSNDIGCTTNFNDMPTEVAWFKNLGDGTFAPRITLSDPTSNIQPYKVVVADLDGDLDNDIVACKDQNGGVLWFENLGFGTFSAQQSIPVSDFQNCLIVEPGDIDGDLDIDLMIGGDYRFFWLENQGNGVFVTADTIANFSWDASSLSLSDLDDDNDLDLCFGTDLNGTMGWIPNLGGGVFDTAQVLHTEGVDPSGGLVALAEINGDGALDLVHLDQFSHVSSQYFGWNKNSVRWYKNTELSIFSDSKKIMPELMTPRMAVAGDIDQDGDLDVVAVSNYDNRIGLFRNLGNGDYSTMELVSDTANYPTTVELHYMNGDNFLDIVVGSYNELKWYPNLGGGNFGSRMLISDSVSGSEFTVADLDSDLDLDIIATRALDGKVVGLYNDGAGSFNSESVLVQNANLVTRIEVADLNGDEHLDIIAFDDLLDFIFWCPNDGGGFFGDTIRISDSLEYLYWTQDPTVYPTDLDQDGDMDILSSIYYTSRTLYFENLGGGIFQPANLLSSIYRPLAIVAADFNMDNEIDIAVNSSSSNNIDGISWLPNLGDEVYPSTTEVEWIDNYEQGYSIEAADIDGDTDVDLLVTSYSNQKVIWYENEMTPVNIENREEKGQLLIHPNPTRDFLTLETAFGESFNIQILDGRGRIVKTSKASDQSRIHISELIPGIYSIIATDRNGKSANGRFIKQ